MSVRVLITGSREYTDRATIAKAISQVYREHGKQQLIIVHGDCPTGADRLAKKIAKKQPDDVLLGEAHPAQWEDANGNRDRSAGPRRNQEMVDLGAVVCLAFYSATGKNIGTSGCVKKAWAAGIPVREHWEHLG